MRVNVMVRLREIIYFVLISQSERDTHTTCAYHIELQDQCFAECTVHKFGPTSL